MVSIKRIINWFKVLKRIINWFKVWWKREMELQIGINRLQRKIRYMEKNRRK